jgi:hypothetical protein
MLTVWPGDRHAVVVVVAPHDRSGTDVYDLILSALGIDEPVVERSKPPCCDEAGRPPAQPDLAAAAVNAVDQFAKLNRRRRRQ